MSQFRTLFEVRFFQRYYDNHTLRDLEVVPSPATQDRLNGFQLKYRVTPESIVVLYDEEKKFLLERQRTPIQLSFGLRSLNRHFETFTLLQPINKKSRYFLDNREAANGGHLHGGDWLDDTRLGSWFPAGEDPHVFLQESEFSLLFEGRTIFDGKSGDKFRWSVDDPIGWYEFTSLTSGGTQRLYRLSDEFRLCWAVVDLFVGGADALSFQRVAGNRYLVGLDHREVYWHYYFVTENGVLPAQIEIYRGKDRLSFSSPEKVQLVNGQWALRLMSQGTFPLKSRPAEAIISAQITNDQSESFAVSVRSLSLPTADATRIKGKLTPAGEVYFWEAYVYL